MLAYQLVELKAMSTVPCYTQGDRTSITMNMLEKVKPLVTFLGQKTYLCGENVTYPDFVLFELCDFWDWITEGKMYERNPSLKIYHDRIM